MKTPDEIKKALKCHKDDGLCLDCPYGCLDLGCSQDFAADALAYIEHLESRTEPKNRVLTLEEVAQSEVMWYDDRLRTGALVVIRVWGQREPDFTRLVDHCGYEMRLWNDSYNDFWRCWLRKPTEAERRETPWEGDNHE